ncbi:MAG: hypothetical protein V7L23_00960 [Nostoc sp.]|uniref:hypothetical protein n=1 Tax=Nostoc sp. TaxID=1180 RepID=UPI002FF37D9F
MTEPSSEMRLKVVLPTKILMETAAIKVIAEAENGMFCLLPRHIDFVATLIPSLLSFVSPQGQEQFLGASTFGRNTGRLEIAATQTLVRLRGLSETRLRGFSLYSPRLLV